MNEQEQTAIARGVALALDRHAQAVAAQMAAVSETLAAINADLSEVRRAQDTARAAGVAFEHVVARRLDTIEAAPPPPTDRPGDVVSVYCEDAELRIVLRSGQHLCARMPDAAALVGERMAEALAAIERASAETERTLQESNARARDGLLDMPPQWSPDAVYEPGARVSCYIGRTYRLKAARGDMTREPGDHPDAWERVGGQGWRVLKSRPAAPEPGDLFAEDGATFLHDGQASKLVFPKSVSRGDVERAVRPAQALAEATQRNAAAAAEQLRNVEIIARDVAARVGDVEDEQHDAAQALQALRSTIQQNRLDADTTAETLRIVAADVARIRDDLQALRAALRDAEA